MSEAKLVGQHQQTEARLKDKNIKYNIYLIFFTLTLMTQSTLFLSFFSFFLKK